MKVKLYDQTGKSVEEVLLPKEIFEVETNRDLLHQVVTSQSSNRRQVIANTKGRGDVRGGGVKPWRQKGTGRARHGSRRSPIWKGGGVTFGPTKERNFKKKINKKIQRQALFMALSDKARNNFIFVLDDLKLEKYKTKLMVEVLKKMKIKGSSLLILPKTDQKMLKAGRNIPNLNIMEANKLNALDLLSVKNVLLPKESLKTIKETFVK
ncbi:MAG: 50S ribosomal protein L4 [bacterium]